MGIIMKRYEYHYADLLSRVPGEDGGRHRAAPASPFGECHGEGVFR